MLKMKFENRQDFYSLPWKFLELSLRFNKTVPKPAPLFLDEMLDVAARVSTDFDFARVDFLTAGNHLYLGEITFCPDGGISKFTNLADERRLGALLSF